MRSELNDSLDVARRACSRCYAHKTFRPNENDKENSKRAVERARLLLKKAFDEKRLEEETTVEQINALKEAKMLCLDALEACKNCDKERPRIKELLSSIK
ncbi:MAG: hypothetical protein PHP82_01310 [Candidatus ainarchaeum sp.]|nr:hypothetical protein [Candidatus ainarchaeum sp.]